MKSRDLPETTVPHIRLEPFLDPQASSVLSQSGPVCSEWAVSGGLSLVTEGLPTVNNDMYEAGETSLMSQ